MAEKTEHNNISLDRAFQIIEYLSSSNVPQTVTEISQALNFNRATTNNLLGTMLRHNYVIKDGHGKYSISSKLFEIGYAYHNHNPLVHAFVQQNFFETHHYNCALGLAIPVHPMKAILLCVQNNMDNFEDIPMVGCSLPAYASGAGKLLLAYASPEQRDAFFARTPMLPLTPNTITDRSVLEQEIELAKVQGYARDTGEVRPHLCCVTAPVFGTRRELTAMVSITGHKDFVLPNEQKLIQDVVSCGKLITFRIGGIAP